MARLGAQTTNRFATAIKRWALPGAVVLLAAVFAAAPPPHDALAATNEPAAAASTPALATANTTTAVLGLTVGKRLPAMTLCDNALSAPPALAKGVPYCQNLGRSLNLRFFDVIGLSPDELRALRVTAVTLYANPTMFDTALGDAAVVIVDARKLIQAIVMAPQRDPDEMLAVLTAKFGELASSDVTTWTDRMTGQEVGTTPNYRWTPPDMVVIYRSKVPTAFGGAGTIGALQILTPAYEQILNDLTASKAKPPPAKTKGN